MIIYVVEQGPYWEHTSVACFSKKEDAEFFVDNWKEFEWTKEHIIIEEYELDAAIISHE